MSYNDAFAKEREVIICMPFTHCFSLVHFLHFSLKLIRENHNKLHTQI